MGGNVKTGFIYIIFAGLLFIPLSSYADDNQVISCQGTFPQCDIGCMPDYDTQDCSLCDNGTYSSTNDATECSACYMPADAQFLTGDSYQGYTADVCPWTLTCAQNTIFNETDKTCDDCPVGSHRDNDLTVTGYGNSNSYEYPDNSNQCSTNVATLNVRGCNNEIKTFDVKYGTGFKESQSSQDIWVDNLAGQLFERNPWWKISGYTYQDDGYTNVTVFDYNGNDTDDNTPGNEKFAQDNGATYEVGATCHTTAYIRVQYTVNGTTSEVNIQLNDDSTAALPDCPSGSSCTWSLNGNFAGVTISGNHITLAEDHFEYVCFEQDCTPTTTIILTLTAECTAGYYRDDNGCTPCPIGTTSEANTTTIEGCYMVKGNTGTKFCDNRGCFHLPLSSGPDNKITYKNNNGN